MPAPLSRRDVAATLALAAVTIGVVSWPLLGTTDLPGSPFGEVDNHAWMAWVGLQRLAGHEGPWSNWPDGWEIPVMDLVNLPLAALRPAHPLQAVLAGNLALAALGGFVLARELTGEVRSAWVGMVGTVAAPFLAGMVDFGITESWTVGWLGLHAAALLRYLRGGGGMALVASTGALVAWLASGWYADVFTVPVELGLLLWGGTRAGPRRMQRLAVATLAGACAAATRIPSLLAYQSALPLWERRFSGLSAAVALPDWRDTPSFGVDLLCFFLPRTDALPVSRTVYLGVTTLVLAGAGLVLGGRGERGGADAGGVRRDGLWALGIVGALLSLALGHWLRIGGELPGPWPLRMPAGLLVEWVPPMRGLSHWFRATGPATLFLAAAAALGAQALLGRLGPRTRTAFALALCAQILLDDVLLAPTAWPRHHYPADPPPELATLPGPGALLELPVDDAGSPPPARSRRPYNQWQPSHGRPVAENYEGPDAVFRLSTVARTLNGLCGGKAPAGTPDALPDDPSADWRALADHGFGWILVHPHLARTPDRCITALRASLGAPQVETGETVGWRIPGAGGGG